MNEGYEGLNCCPPAYPPPLLPWLEYPPLPFPRPRPLPLLFTAATSAKPVAAAGAVAAASATCARWVCVAVSVWRAMSFNFSSVVSLSKYASSQRTRGASRRPAVNRALSMVFCASMNASYLCLPVTVWSRCGRAGGSALFQYIIQHFNCPIIELHY